MENLLMHSIILDRLPIVVSGEIFTLDMLQDKCV